MEEKLAKLTKLISEIEDPKRVSGTPSRLKNPLKMNHPRMNPEMKRSEYHLMATGPMLKISGLTLQCTANVSNINSFFNPAKIIISLITTTSFYPHSIQLPIESDACNGHAAQE